MATPTPDWMKKLPAAEMLQKVPEGTLSVALEWARLDPQARFEKVEGGHPWQRRQVEGTHNFEEFLQKRGLTQQQYNVSFTGTGVNAGDLNQAIRQTGIETAQKTLTERISLAQAEGRPLKALVPEGKDAKILQQLAAESPEGYKLAHGYSVAKAQTPGKSLEGHLADIGVSYKEYLQKVGTKMPGEILRAMDTASELAERIGKAVSHTKVGKAFTVATSLGGLMIEGASAHSLKDAGGKVAVAVASTIDPTALVGPSLLGNAVAKGVGQKSELEEMGVDTAKINLRPSIIKAVEFNSRIEREQAFLLSPQHPAQLGSLKLKDSLGQDVDIAASLRDPKRRDGIMNEIDRRLAGASTPDAKEMLTSMRESATTFSAMEDRRKPLPADMVIPRLQAAPTASGMTLAAATP